MNTRTKEIILYSVISLTLAIVIALTVITSVSLSKVNVLQKRVTEQTQESETAAPPVNEEVMAEITSQRLYVLGVRDGKLTVYASDGTTIVEILSTYIYYLPENDRRALSEGIDVYSSEELSSLIQDYTS